MNLREIFQIDEFVDFQESDVSQLRRVFKLNEEDLRDIHEEDFDEKSLYNFFTDDVTEFIVEVTDACKRICGDNFEEVIDAQNYPGAMQWALAQMWENFSSPYEAVSDLCFLFEISQDGSINVYYTHAKIIAGERTLTRTNSHGDERDHRPLRSNDFGPLGESIVKEEDEFRDYDSNREWMGTDFKNPFLDVFPATFPEYLKLLDEESEKVFGVDYMRVIDDWEGWSGATMWLIQQLWDSYYTLYEALYEIGFVFDSAQSGWDSSQYPNTNIVQGQRTIEPKEEMIFTKTGEPIVRETRPMNKNYWKDLERELWNQGLLDPDYYGHNEPDVDMDDGPPEN